MNKKHTEKGNYFYENDILVLYGKGLFIYVEKKQQNFLFSF
jgi:hypothetical protein